MAEKPDNSEAREMGSHPRIAVGLIVAATLILLIGLHGTWAKRQLYNTDAWVQTSGELLADETIRTRLAERLTTEIFATGIVQTEVEELLPPRAKAAAAPASLALSQLFQRAVNQILQTAAIQDLWEKANRSVHEAFLAIAENRPIASGVLGKAQGATESAALDLNEIRTAVAMKLGLELPEEGLGSGEALQASIEAGDAQAGLEVIAPDQIKTIRGVTKLVEKGSVFLIILGILLYVAAVVITPGSRRRMLIGCGVSLLVVGVATLAIRSILGETVVSELAASDAGKPAVGQVWEIATEMLRSMGLATLLYGLVVIAGAVLAGPTRAATWLRRQLAPALRDPIWAFGAAALGILLLVWWGPTPAFRDPLGVLIIVALLLVGVAALRKQTLEEFPASTPTPS